MWHVYLAFVVAGDGGVTENNEEHVEREREREIVLHRF
jgi:hypothetical protein